MVFVVFLVNSPSLLSVVSVCGHTLVWLERLSGLAMVLIQRGAENIASPEESNYERLIGDNLGIKFELCSC